MTRALARVIESANGTLVTLDGRALVSFAGCDLLGLARHREVLAAAHGALDRYGASASASRTTTGTLRVHLDLEDALRRFFGTKDAVTLPAGWLAAQALARVLAPDADSVLLDESAHPALIDAAHLVELPIARYAHFNAEDAARKARGEGRVLILTDGIDAARGRLAPLPALAKLAAATGGHLIVDDAHGAGVLGPTGRGTASHLGVRGTRVNLVGSLSKAFGSQGGFVVGTTARCDAVRAEAAVFAGATPLAPSAAGAAAASVRVAAAFFQDSARTRAYAARIRQMRRHLTRLALPVPQPGLPWFSVTAEALPSAGKPSLAKVSARLADLGFLVPAIDYFGGPEGGILKIAVSAAHTAAQIDGLAAALESALAPRATSSRRRTSR